MRLAEKNGAETVLTATGNARQSFEPVQLWRIYNIEIPGACVKNAVLCGRYGISALLEIRLSYPCRVTLSKEAWPFLHHYDLCPWDELNQVAEKTLVDVVGRATEDVSLDPVSPLKKSLVRMQYGNFVQTVELLGEFANLQIRKGDAVLCGGLRVKEYQEERSLETTYLSLVEINSKTAGEIPHIEEGQPKRKAMRMTDGTILHAAQVLDMATAMEHSASTGQTPSTTDFVLKGTFKAFEATFFDNDPPTVDSNGTLKMCWKTYITDASGTVEVNLWDKACFSIFEMTATRFQQCWEEGYESKGKREDLLNKLNKNLAGTTYTAFCNMKLNTYGLKEPIHKAEIHVNNAEAWQTL